jgi:hypothetical protein
MFARFAGLFPEFLAERRVARIADEEAGTRAACGYAEN